MLTVLLVLQIIITVAMIVVILIQRNSSDGMAGLAGGGNSIMSGRASANLLTRVTAIFAAVFIANSLLMAAITARSSTNGKSIVDEIKIEQKSPSVPLADAPIDTKDTHKTDGVVTKQDKHSNKSAIPDDGQAKPVVPVAE